MSRIEMPRIARFVENGEPKFVVSKGGVGLQLSYEEARYLVRFLGLFAGREELMKAESGILKEANGNSTPLKPLGV